MLGGISSSAARRVEKFNRSFNQQYDSCAAELGNAHKLAQSIVEEADVCEKIQTVIPKVIMDVTDTSMKDLLKQLEAMESDQTKNSAEDAQLQRELELEQKFQKKFNEQARLHMDEFRERQIQAESAPETSGATDKIPAPQEVKKGDAVVEIVDSHLHYADRSKFKYEWWGSAGLPDRDWAEEDYTKAWKACPGIKVGAAVFVEVAVGGGSAAGFKEAQWALDMVSDPASPVKGVVAYVPVPEGAAAVKEYLAQFCGSAAAASHGGAGAGKSKKKKKGKGKGAEPAPAAEEEAGAEGSPRARALPPGLKGARAVLAGAAPDACVDPAFVEGLKEVHAHGLTFDVCIKPPALPYLLQLAQACPQVPLVLDHLAKPEGDLDSWKECMDALAQCPNVVLKLSAVEEWDIGAPAEVYLEHALTTFGAHRCMFGSNWFVSEGLRFPYSRMYQLVAKALDNIHADEGQRAAVFSETAKRVYCLDV